MDSVEKDISLGDSLNSSENRWEITKDDGEETDWEIQPVSDIVQMNSWLFSKWGPQMSLPKEKQHILSRLISKGKQEANILQTWHPVSKDICASLGHFA